MQPLVYIIILNWNGLKDTLACLKSVEKMNYSNYRVVVVDNGSTDDSVGKIKKIFPEVTLIINQGNLGFSGGCNVGIQLALKCDAESIWLLNNDVLVTPSALSELCKVQYEEGYDLVGSDLRNYPDCGWQGGGGNISFLRGLTFSVPCTSRRMQSISGASVLVRSRVFQRIGLLDDRFFLYWEDVDFSFRARKAGFKLKVACDSIVFHRESASAGRISTLKAYYISRNCIFFLKKHYIFAWIILIWPFLARNFFSALKNHLPITVIAKSVRDGLLNNLGKRHD